MCRICCLYRNQYLNKKACLHFDWRPGCYWVCSHNARKLYKIKTGMRYFIVNSESPMTSQVFTPARGTWRVQPFLFFFYKSSLCAYRRRDSDHLVTVCQCLRLEVQFNNLNIRGWIVKHAQLESPPRICLHLSLFRKYSHDPPSPLRSWVMIFAEHYDTLGIKWPSRHMSRNVSYSTHSFFGYTQFYDSRMILTFDQQKSHHLIFDSNWTFVFLRYILVHETDTQPSRLGLKQSNQVQLKVCSQILS